MRCRLCGYTFSPEEGDHACRSCPVGKGCDLVCCPHCNYQWPTSSKAESFLRRLFTEDKVIEAESKQDMENPGERKE